MANPSQERILKAVLKQHGYTLSQELGIALKPESAAALFRLLCAAMLSSARIKTDVAIKAAKGLAARGWITAKALAGSTWNERVKVLNEAGYVRYQQRTATLLGNMAQRLLEKYQGDLRKLREKADRRPDEERRLLKQFRGLGDVGADIFFREVQIVWEELRPFVDQRALRGARKLGLQDDPQSLARLAGERDLPRFVAGLVWTQLEHDFRNVLQNARQ